MFLRLSETGNMIFIIVAFEGDMAINADERRRFATAKSMFFYLFLLESGVAVAADKGDHLLKYNN